MTNEPLPTPADAPTPEQLIGRQVRMLRQVQGWSQQEVAERMRAYGYEWSQATVTRLEAATRPIRLNELADLAALFGMRVAQFVDLWTPEYGLDDLGALQKELADLESERGALQGRLETARTAKESADIHLAQIAAEAARLASRTRVLRQWLQRLTQHSGEQVEGGDGK